LLFLSLSFFICPFSAFCFYFFSFSLVFILSFLCFYFSAFCFFFSFFLSRFLFLLFLLLFFLFLSRFGCASSSFHWKEIVIVHLLRCLSSTLINSISSGTYKLAALFLWTQFSTERLQCLKHITQTQKSPPSFAMIRAFSVYNLPSLPRKKKQTFPRAAHFQSTYTQHETRDTSERASVSFEGHSPCLFVRIATVKKKKKPGPGFSGDGSTRRLLSKYYTSAELCLRACVFRLKEASGWVLHYPTNTPNKLRPWTIPNPIEAASSHATPWQICKKCGADLSSYMHGCKERAYATYIDLFPLTQHYLIYRPNRKFWTFENPHRSTKQVKRWGRL
jgi:hypothetical protein